MRPTTVSSWKKKDWTYVRDCRGRFNMKEIWCVKMSNTPWPTTHLLSGSPIISSIPCNTPDFSYAATLLTLLDPACETHYRCYNPSKLGSYFPTDRAKDQAHTLHLYRQITVLDNFKNLTLTGCETHLIIRYAYFKCITILITPNCLFGREWHLLWISIILKWLTLN